MQQSEAINEIAAALSKAQSEIHGAKASSVNPFFKSKYADLASCLEAIREPFTSNGLAVVQTTKPTEGEGVTVVTTLCHSSGQWFAGELKMIPEKKGPQAVGICITYARRYALAAIAGLAQIDDDAEGATDRDKDAEARRAAGAALLKASGKGSDELDRTWEGLPVPVRQYLTENQGDWLKTLRIKAESVTNGIV